MPDDDTPRTSIEWTVRPDRARYRRLLQLLFAVEPADTGSDEEDPA